MPQASAETDRIFENYFGKEASDAEALEFLESQGIKPTRGGVFFIEKERDIGKIKAALDYLLEEWDYAVETIGGEEND